MEIETIEPRRWTREEIRRFRRLYPVTSNKELAKIFHRTLPGIKRKAAWLGIGKDWAGGYLAPYNKNPWTDAEFAELRSMYRDSTIPEIAKKLGRTAWAVQSKIKKLQLLRELRQQGLTRRHKGQWPDEQIATLKKLYPVETNVQIARRLGKTPNAVGRMVQKLGLSKLFRKNTGRGGGRTRVTWTDTEDAFLKEHIFIWPVKRIAKHLGKSISSVKARGWKKRLLKQNLWTRQETLQLQYMLPRCSYKEIAAKLEKSVEAVKRKRKRLGLKGKGWNDQEIALLRKFYPIETNAAVARRLGKSPPTIVSKARKLGLRKSIYAGFASIGKRRGKIR